MALFLYRVLFIALTPLLLLALVIRSFNHPQYRQRLLERLGITPSEIKQHQIIVHAASVGEVIAIKTYVEQLLLADENILITTFTPTGSAQVKKQFGDSVEHCYLPLDIWPCTWLFLKRIKPKALVFMETELWPNVIAQAKSQNLKLQLINARLSEKSVTSYQKISALISPTINCFDQVLSQSEESHQRFLALKANPDNCQLLGNLKFDLESNEKINEKAQHLGRLLPDNKTLWLVASTHQGDEELVLSSFKKLHASHPDLLLVVVPRHPERFQSVFELCQQQGFQCQKRSADTAITPETNVWVLDTLGELMSAYQLADVVTIGGTFSSIGGHNPLEPALFNKPIIVGKDMSNFAEIAIQLMNAKGIVQLAGGDYQAELYEQISQLIELPQVSQQLGSNAHSVVLANQGASAKAAKLLLDMLYQ